MFFFYPNSRSQSKRLGVTSPCSSWSLQNCNTAWKISPTFQAFWWTSRTTSKNWRKNVMLIIYSFNMFSPFWLNEINSNNNTGCNQWMSHRKFIFVTDHIIFNSMLSAVSSHSQLSIKSWEILKCTGMYESGLRILVRNAGGILTIINVGPKREHVCNSMSKLLQ